MDGNRDEAMGNGLFVAYEMYTNQSDFFPSLVKCRFLFQAMVLNHWAFLNKRFGLDAEGPIPFKVMRAVAID